MKSDDTLMVDNNGMEDDPMMSDEDERSGDMRDGSRTACSHKDCNNKCACATTWYCEECRMQLCHTGHRETDCFLLHHLSEGLYNQV